MVKIIPWRQKCDEDGDIICEFNMQGSRSRTNSKIFKHYETIVCIDPITKQLIILKSRCSCDSFNFSRFKDENFICKHIKTCKKVVFKFPEELE